MKSLDQLIDLKEAALPQIREWIASANTQCTLLPPSVTRAEVLLKTQLTTRSTMGAIAYETGGVLVDHGWLRFLGSGHPTLTRTLPGWNDDKADRCYFIADDAVGGFFAMNGGAFGNDSGNVYYWPPDAFAWEPMQMGFTAFFQWALTGHLDEFYASLRWLGWKEEIASMSGDRCVAFFPFLWTKESSPETSHRRTVPIAEAFLLKKDILDRLDPK